MKFVYFNDTGRLVSIHPATEAHGCKCDMSPIEPFEERVFILPEGTYPWLKQWSDGTILVSPKLINESELSREYKESVEINSLKSQIEGLEMIIKRLRSEK